MRSVLGPALGLLLIATLSCGDDDKGPAEPNEPASPTTGSIHVSLAMSGADMDADGCTVTVDSGSAQPLNAGATVAFSDLAAGIHEIAIGDVAANCQVEGGASRSVTVAAGVTTRDSFTAVCDWRSRIAFSAAPAARRTDIFVMNPDGTGLVNLTNQGDDRDLADRYPEWSPDGTKIAFQRVIFNTRGGDLRDLFVMNSDGSGEVNLTNDPGRLSFSWSPDGTQIAFRCGADICITSPDGTGRVQLTNRGDNQYDGPISWSPDGTRIVVKHGRDICFLNSDGTGEVHVTSTDYPESDRGAVLSPDGARIAFVRTTDGRSDRPLYVINTDGTDEVLVAYGAYGSGPTWSPDGTQILFEDLDIFAVRPDGTRLLNLTRRPGEESHPTWSPDGDQIAFRCDAPDDEKGICVMKADGTEQVQLFVEDGTRYWHSPSWSPDLY